MTTSQWFPYERTAIPAARHFADHVLAALPAGVRETLILMVSELATNCIRHTTSAFELSIALEANQVRVEVTDLGSGEPFLCTPADDEPTGRGLQIVGALADDWGVRPGDDGVGKTVWFTYGLDPAFPDASVRAQSSTLEAPCA